MTTDGTHDLADGTRSITARQTEPGKPESGDSPALSITVDTAPPAAPSVPDLQATSDTGVFNTDNVTADNTPTFALSGASPYFRFYRNSTKISGDWETANPYTLATQADGVYNYQATAVDAAGNESALSLAVSVTIDTATPRVPAAPDLQAASDTGISGTDNITADNTPTFTVAGRPLLPLLSRRREAQRRLPERGDATPPQSKPTARTSTRSLPSTGRQ